MPDLVGERLDVAKSDLSAAGISENDVEVVGGGTFGVVVESNWTVCEQSPSPGSTASDVRVIVDRECDEEDTEGGTGTSPPTTDAPPQPTPATTDAPSLPAAVTDAEVVDAFRTFLDQRAASGVLIARAVTDLSFSHRVLRATFDPAAAGLDQATFDRINPFENLADFVSSPLAFNTDLGIRLRPAIDTVETVRADGTPLGSRTTAEIIAMNELGK
jgi:hypothetical protein